MTHKQALKKLTPKKPDAVQKLAIIQLENALARLQYLESQRVKKYESENITT